MFQVGGYLRVLLHGRRQRQMEDRQFYLAIRCAVSCHTACHTEQSLNNNIQCS